MPPTDRAPDPARPSAADINSQIRALATGRAYWTPEARQEWQRLTAEWRAAVERETVVPAA
jgi:hypothetical protein